MKRTWIGNYIDVDKDEKVFEIPFRIDVELAENLSFTGKAWEEEFYELTNMLIDVKGFILDDHISFINTYPCYYGVDGNMDIYVNKNEKGHQVIYDGYWNQDRGIWGGTWEIKMNIVFKTHDYYEEEISQGQFEMRLMEED
ncbi:MAG: hypothetical protein N4A41_06805 [Crocinitomicaceae bacterium]|jgi:hypothetical protein|nr:hypothetical protein [Crocinitomicaceae bacterium]